MGWSFWQQTLHYFCVSNNWWHVTNRHTNSGEKLDEKKGSLALNFNEGISYA